MLLSLWQLLLDAAANRLPPQAEQQRGKLMTDQLVLPECGQVTTLVRVFTELNVAFNGADE